MASYLNYYVNNIGKIEHTKNLEPFEELDKDYKYNFMLYGCCLWLKYCDMIYLEDPMRAVEFHNTKCANTITLTPDKKYEKLIKFESKHFCSYVGSIYPHTPSNLTPIKKVFMYDQHSVLCDEPCDF